MIYTAIHWSVRLTCWLAYRRNVGSVIWRAGLRSAHANVVDNLSKYTLTVWRRIVTLVICFRPCIFRSQRNAFKINMSFGFILSIFHQPLVVADEPDLQRVLQRVGEVDWLEYVRQQKRNSK